MGAVMQHKFCSIYTFKKQMYIDRLARANGPNCLVWPPKSLYSGLTHEQLVAEIAGALSDYKELGRSIYAPEGEELNQRFLAFFGEKTTNAFERKKKSITIRQDLPHNTYNLFASWTGSLLCELHTLDEVASKVLEQLGHPATHAPTTLLA